MKVSLEKIRKITIDSRLTAEVVETVAEIGESGKPKTYRKAYFEIVKFYGR